MACHVATSRHAVEAGVGLESLEKPLGGRVRLVQQAPAQPFATPRGSRVTVGAISQRGVRSPWPPGKGLAALAGQCRAASEAATADAGAQGDAAALAARFDVSSSCVTPVFRSSPQAPSGPGADAAAATANVLFLSEGDVCRSVVAQAILGPLLERSGLDAIIACASKGTRDYNAGEEPDPRTRQVAAARGLRLPEGHVARVFEPAVDIVAFDLILVMDKFVAADCLKEVSVFDTIDPTAFYSSKVRSLGEFATGRKIGDIDDPLYGNMGDPSELDLLSNAIDDIRDSCQGVVSYLQSLQQSLQDGESLKQRIARSLREMTALDWLVPPMLQKR